MMDSHLPRSASASLPPAARPSFEALFSYGFRPFFLGAAVQAAVTMALWIGWLATVSMGNAPDGLPVAGSPIAWHAHEMVFGFAAAAIGGFLLTAVPNWTGALPLSGLPLPRPLVLFCFALLGPACAINAVFVALALPVMAPYGMTGLVIAGLIGSVLGILPALWLARRIHEGLHEP